MPAGYHGRTSIVLCPLYYRAALLAAALLSGCVSTSPPRGVPVLWRDPGDVAAFDFTYGAGGPGFLPAAPFRFEREDMRGTSPKVFVRDAAGREWRVKGGREVRSEAFCTRLAAAIGYYAEPTYFVASGRMEGVGNLRRASGFIQNDGAFTYASFERFEPGLKFLPETAWSWASNPFEGTPQLNGLKILVMLVSDWDNKDARNSIRGSNLGILERDGGAAPRLIYFVDDWGQSLGKWGQSYDQTSTFDCAGYSGQTAAFVRRGAGGELRFGYLGQHTTDFMRGIGRGDAAWLLHYLGRVSEGQLRAGLRASGASADETTCFTAALEARIGQLRAAAPEPGQPR